jgi:hypothetical protein
MQAGEVSCCSWVSSRSEPALRVAHLGGSRPKANSPALSAFSPMAPQTSPCVPVIDGWSLKLFAFTVDDWSSE